MKQRTSRQVSWTWFGSGAVLLILASLASVAAQSPNSWKTWVDSGQQAMDRGEWGKAAESYEKAAQMASTVEERAEAKLNLAQAWARSRDKLGQSEQMYRQVIEDTSSQSLKPDLQKLRLRAQNNLANLLFVQGKTAAAADQLAAIEPEMKRAENARSRPAYLYNFGCALEAAGQKDRAFALFEESATLDPTMRPSIESAFRTAYGSSSETRGIPQMASLLKKLTENRDLQTADRYLRASLTQSHWIGHPQYDRLLVALVQLLTAASTGPQDYVSRWQKDLGPLASKLSGGTASRLADISAAYEKPLPILFEPHELGPVFRDWQNTREQQQAFSQFLKMIGDFYSRSGSPEMALQRYSTAWRMYPENMEAALYMTNTLLAFQEKLDPQGQLVQKLVEGLFHGKGQAYLSGGDWANILRFHTLLGTIFEKQKSWGSSSDPRSAVFQWEHALRAHDQLVRSNPSSASVVPGLNEKLALAYEATGQKPRAWEQHVKAAEGYVRLGQMEAASSSVRQADRIQVSPSQLEQQRRMQELRKTIQDRQPKELVRAPKRDDRGIERELVQKLEADPHTRETKLRITASNGVVTLAGQVDEHVLRSEVEKLARETDGVKEVKNTIAVTRRKP